MREKQKTAEAKKGSAQKDQTIQELQNVILNMHKKIKKIESSMSHETSPSKTKMQMFH